MNLGTLLLLRFILFLSFGTVVRLSTMSYEY